MPRVSWIKLFINIFDNPKIKYLRRLEQGNDFVLIWIMLLVLAGKCNDGGKISIAPNVPFTVEELAEQMKYPPEIVEQALQLFSELDMVEDFVILDWETHQDTEKMEKIKEQNRERAARHRAKIKEKKVTQSNGVTVTQSNDVTVTQNHALCNATDKIREDKNRLDKTRKEKKIKGELDYSGLDLGDRVITALKEFVEMRKAIKKPIVTQKALELQAEKLVALSMSEDEQITILENSIANSWQGLFPLKKEKKSKAEDLLEFAREIGDAQKGEIKWVHQI